MIRILMLGLGSILALTLGLSSTARATEPCKDCDAAPVQSARERIREERAQNAKRIADEPVSRPWDGSRPGPRPTGAPPTK